VHAHRTLRQLALKLTSLGYHTLRFDYFGTGDSAGEIAHIDPAGMQSDLESAIEAAQDIAGADRVALIGLRLGANLAAHVAALHCSDLEALVLWDPIGDLPGFTGLELCLQSLPPALAARSLLLSSQRPQLPSRYDTAARGAVRMELIEAPCPWIESATTTGALPVRVFQRIEQWLKADCAAACPALERV
jgi:pimeloyl-ACP methyl ester carboxylesterase